MRFNYFTQIKLSSKTKVFLLIAMVFLFFGALFGISTITKAQTPQGGRNDKSALNWYNQISSTCRDGGTCSAEDRSNFSRAAGFCPASGNVCSSPVISQIESLRKTIYPDAPQPPTPAADPNSLPSDELKCNGLTSCLVLLMYYIGPGLAGYVAYVGAYFFSIVVQISLNSTAYALDFLSQGWTIVRDLANMAFIFILIYLAMTVMLQAETTGTIKTLATVIVIALLVNFSFFFTRVVIDGGNILAVQFYNSIDTVKAPNGQPLTINGVKDLSASLMGASGPQVLLSKETFEKVQNRQNGGSLATLGLFTVIFLSVAVMLWMLFFAFIQVGIKFMLRIVGLWFLLIASPLAFVARTMKQTTGYFDQWLKYLVEFAFYPAIFLFMFLILTRFASSLMSYGTQNGQGGQGAQGASLLNSIGQAVNVTSANGEGAVTIIAVVAIRMGFVLALMYVSLRVSDWIVKEGSSIASTATGRVTGAGFGAVGLAGRNTIGTFANRFIPGPIGARLGRTTFDVRNSQKLNSALGYIGGGADLKKKKLDFGRGSEVPNRPRPTQAGEKAAENADSARESKPSDAAASLSAPNVPFGRNRLSRPLGTTPAANPIPLPKPQAETAVPISQNNTPTVQAASSRIANIIRGNTPPKLTTTETPSITNIINHIPPTIKETSAAKLPKEMDVSAESREKIKSGIKKEIHKSITDVAEEFMPNRSQPMHRQGQPMDLKASQAALDESRPGAHKIEGEVPKGRIEIEGDNASDERKAA